MLVLGAIVAFCCVWVGGGRVWRLRVGKSIKAHVLGSDDRGRRSIDRAPIPAPPDTQEGVTPWRGSRPAPGLTPRPWRRMARHTRRRSGLERVPTARHCRLHGAPPRRRMIDDTHLLLLLRRLRCCRRFATTRRRRGAASRWPPSAAPLAAAVARPWRRPVLAVGACEGSARRKWGRWIDRKEGSCAAERVGRTGDHHGMLRSSYTWRRRGRRVGWTGQDRITNPCPMI